MKRLERTCFFRDNQMMMISGGARKALSKLSSAFLVFAGFLAVFFTVSNSRMPSLSGLPLSGGGVAYADAPSSGGASAASGADSGSGGGDSGDGSGDSGDSGDSGGSGGSK